MKTIRPLLGAVAVAVCAAAPVHAQRAHFGAHAGYNFDRERGLVGAQALIPVSPMVEFYPSVDFSLRDPNSRVGLNLDLKVRQPGTSALYAGGGLNILRSSVGGTTSSDAGGNLFAGLESRLGATHPYVEVRGLMHGNSSIQLIGGVNFTLR